MMKLAASALYFLVVIGLSGCVTGPTASTPEQEAYLQEIMAEPIEFDLPKSQGDDAMGRAQVFIAKYSSMKIQTATNNVVDTYNVASGTPFGPQPYGYKVLRSNIGDTAHFTIECFNGLEGVIYKSVHVLPARNARFLARYMKTGKLDHSELIAH